MADLSREQVIARIERMRDTCKTDESIANEHDRPDDAVWARDNVETLDACLILLRQQQGWQPIETAPKDREILLYGKRRFTDGIAQGAWNSGGAMHLPHWMGDVTQPTHWMPLPSPPSGAE
jgi:hypothetical protein